MQSAVLVVLVALVSCTIGLPNVRRFSIDEKHQKPVQLKSWKFTNCLPTAKEVMIADPVTFGPDPLVFPGPLSVAFTVNFTADVDSPLKTSVYLGKKVGSSWVKVPCIGQIGSCTYDDLCDILSTIGECPGPFSDNGVPCMCPFKKGSYTLPTSNFDVESAIFPPGDYHGQANLTMGATVVGCYNVLATFG